MKRIVKILILFISCSCSGQKNPNPNDYLSLFKTHFTILDGDDWEVLVEWQDSREITIYATKHFADTVLGIRVHRHIVSEDRVIYEFRDANREFNFESDFVDYQGLDENLNVIYWYKYRREDEAEMVFVSGKYYYQYLEGLLNEHQQKYFLQNKDSLMQIRGNNLSTLPERFK